MKKIAFITFLLLTIISKSIIAQTDTVSNTDNCVDFFLINSLNPKKKIKLKSKSELISPGSFSLTIDAAAKDPSILSNKITYDIIYFNRLDGKNLSFNYKNEAIEYSMDSKTYTDYLNCSRDKNIVINLDNLKEIDYMKSTNNTLFGVGYFAMSLSFITSAVIAPLVSINYKNGDFNKERYYKVAGSGLICMGASIPLLFFGKTKTYKMTQFGKEQDKELWYLEMHNRKDPVKK
jgi:hypothetical protein